MIATHTQPVEAAHWAIHFESLNDCFGPEEDCLVFTDADVDEPSDYDRCPDEPVFAPEAFLLELWSKPSEWHDACVHGSKRWVCSDC